MAELRTFRCRFFPSLPTRELKTFHVRVKWWAFDDDRLSARGDAKLNEANVEVRHEDAAAARKLVVREWNGVSSFIGQAVEVAA
jgi:hypothetical protein